MVDNVNYQKARSYAYKINKYIYMDVLHDAYVAFHRTTGRNLFLEPRGKVLKMIKFTYMDLWKYNGRQGRSGTRVDFEPYTSVTPEDILIGKETLASLHTIDRAVFRKNPNTTNDIVSLKLSGYKNTEIAERLDITKALVSYYLRNLKTRLN